MQLLAFILKRILQAIPLLLGVSFITFVLINQTPGSYLDKMRLDPQIPEAFIKAEEQRLGLNDPWALRYGKWLKGIVWGDNSMWTPPWKDGGCLNFGYSFAHKRPVFDVLGDRLLNTLILSISSMAFAWIVSIPLGIIAGVKQYKWPDKLASGIAFFGISMPNVFLALLAIYFALKTGWFPTGGLHDARNYNDMNGWQRLVDYAHHLVLPTLVLGTAMTATLMRQMRGQILDVLKSDYIRTARAKGLSEKVVMAKHAFRNAINPLITLLGYSISDLLSGAFLVEVVMSLPGLGKTTIEALFNKDLFLVTASVLLATAMLVLGNLCADILLAMSDPRITFKSSREAG